MDDGVELGSAQDAPNWCINVLEVTSDEDDDALTHFYQQNKPEGDNDTRELSFACSVPIPAQGTSIVELWGTRSDVDSVLVDREELLLRYDFETEWSPPLAWIAAVAQRFPQLAFHLKSEEPGADFHISAKYRGGAEVEFEETTFSEHEWANLSHDQREHVVQLLVRAWEEVCPGVELSDDNVDAYRDDVWASCVDEIQELGYCGSPDQVFDYIFSCL
eukprot:m.187787 g.187787  ORF g.187787 m.187787 type:complete len:218 (-) comp14781_c0_seq1:1396-2049(-)